MENLDASVERALITLNKVRNLCAHDISFELDDSHWESIFEPFIKDMPYDSISTLKYMRWKRWSYWILGIFFLQLIFTRLKWELSILGQTNNKSLK